MRTVNARRLDKKARGGIRFHGHPRTASRLTAQGQGMILTVIDNDTGHVLSKDLTRRSRRICICRCIGTGQGRQGTRDIHHFHILVQGINGTCRGGCQYISLRLHAIGMHLWVLWRMGFVSRRGQAWFRGLASCLCRHTLGLRSSPGPRTPTPRGPRRRRQVTGTGIGRDIGTIPGRRILARPLLVVIVVSGKQVFEGGRRRSHQSSLGRRRIRIRLSRLWLLCCRSSSSVLIVILIIRSSILVGSKQVAKWIGRDLGRIASRQGFSHGIAHFFPRCDIAQFTPGSIGQLLDKFTFTAAIVLLHLLGNEFQDGRLLRFGRLLGIQVHVLFDDGPEADIAGTIVIATTSTTHDIVFARFKAVR